MSSIKGLHIFWIHILIVFIIGKRLTGGDLEPTFARCCALGANWARERQNCLKFPAPVPSEPSEHQSICITAASICCLRYYRESQCESAKQAAKSGSECSASSEPGGEYFKDCCDGCKLGLISGSMAMKCSFKGFSFGYPWNAAYHECCIQALPPGAIDQEILSSETNIGLIDQKGVFPNLDTDDENFLFTNRIDGDVNIPDSENLCLLFPGQLCGHVCVPTRGSYVCQCRAGFTLSVDGKTCIQTEIKDRCEANNPCDHICRDTGVSIECSCNLGYHLALDQRSCNDINECLHGTHLCLPSEQVCYNQPGTYACINSDGSLSTPGLSWGHDQIRPESPIQGFGIKKRLGVQGYTGSIDELDTTKQGMCPPGYKFNLETRLCDDVDECIIALGICGQGFSCQNTIGSYSCVPLITGECPSGFAFDINHQSCLDINECNTEIPKCGLAEICINTQGSYECKSIGTVSDCPPGYKINSQTNICEDVNECLEGLHSCHPSKQTCRNIIGSYECDMKCQEGFQYSSNPPSCVDLNECLVNIDTCSPISEICVNTVGSYHCESYSENDVRHVTPLSILTLPKVTLATPVVQECPNGFGFDLNTTRCLDIDECSQGISNCLPGQICVNTEGSFDCRVECRDGFKYEPLDPAICVDVNECDNSPCDFDERCINTEGSYACFRVSGIDHQTFSTELPDIDYGFTPVMVTSTVTTKRPRVTTKAPCPSGYKKKRRYSECKDINECSEELDTCLRATEDCINLPGTFTCRPKPCSRGFYRDTESSECTDIDECSNLPCRMTEECINVPGSFICRVRPPCNDGFRRNNLTNECEDIDECVESVPCELSTKCINTKGGYRCRSLECSAGYQMNPNTEQCEDVNECETGEHVCRASFEQCINNPGAYRCKPFPPCSVGFKRDPKTERCVDVDECAEGLSTCGVGETCINQYGRYKCVALKVECLQGYEVNPSSNRCQVIDACATEPSKCSPQERCVSNNGSYKCVPKSLDCNSGFAYDEQEQMCKDIDECKGGLHLCSVREKCVNLEGIYLCERLDYSHDFSFDLPLTTAKTTTAAGTTVLEVKKPGGGPGVLEGPLESFGLNNCGFGYVYDQLYSTYIDECLNLPCDKHELCLNTLGSFECDCSDGFARDSITGDCKDINECQLGLHTCERLQRCDNTLGSYTCTRISGCGTGYTLNHHTGTCEDDDECQLGTNDCRQLGPKWTCVNTKGSFRCEKKTCPETQILNSWGLCVNITCTPGYTPSFKKCVDINECTDGDSPCKRNERCFNLVGSFECRPKINCGRGYTMNEDGNQCIDIDECEDGSHTCSASQLCLNRPGGYVCQCPQGYRLDANRECQDINECQTAYASLCGNTGKCENTPGSYRCICREGFKKTSEGETCIDIDECSEVENVCEHNCINVWGSHYCTCNAGYIVMPDNRTCADIDECEEIRGRGRLCLGLCVNTPGTFKCSCPDGYRLEDDQRTCKDINECDTIGKCRNAEDICVNTRGGFKCQRITCPPNYVRDQTHRNRCKKETLCLEDDLACLQRPLTYSYNFLPLASNMTLRPLGQVDLFTMRGPLWSSTNVQFDLEFESVSVGSEGVTPASKVYFILNRTAFNQVVLTLIKSLEGPQEVQLNLNMKLYHNGYYEGSAVAKLLIFVSEYDF